MTGTLLIEPVSTKGMLLSPVFDSRMLRVGTKIHVETVSSLLETEEIILYIRMFINEIKCLKLLSLQDFSRIIKRVCQICQFKFWHNFKASYLQSKEINSMTSLFQLYLLSAETNVATTRNGK